MILIFCLFLLFFQCQDCKAGRWNWTLKRAGWTEGRERQVKKEEKEIEQGLPLRIKLGAEKKPTNHKFKDNLISICQIKRDSQNLGSWLCFKCGFQKNPMEIDQFWYI